MIFYAFSVSCIALSIQFLKVQYKIEEWISRYSDGFVPIRAMRLSSMTIDWQGIFQPFTGPTGSH